MNADDIRTLCALLTAYRELDIRRSRDAVHARDYRTKTVAALDRMIAECHKLLNAYGY